MSLSTRKLMQAYKKSNAPHRSHVRLVTQRSPQSESCNALNRKIITKASIIWWDVYSIIYLYLYIRYHKEEEEDEENRLLTELVHQRKKYVNM